MIHKIPCIKQYIYETNEGNRNQNLFKALNHLRRFNKHEPLHLMEEEAEKLNQYFKEPLPTNEVKNILKHVTNHNYRSNCKHFEHYCQRCRYGDMKERYNEINPRYHWHIKEDNTLYGFPGLPDGTYYPWDFEDTSKLDRRTKRRIMELREFKGISPLIDQEILANGIPVGDEALKEYLEYLKGE